MSLDDKEEARMYKVVVNHEEQYSIWPAHKEIPAGWSAVGTEGEKDACLGWIREHWTDMRPKSLRERMEGGPRTEAE
jgi:MbtH protein